MPRICSKCGDYTVKFHDCNAARIAKDALFDLGPLAMDSPRLKKIKEHDIQTHYSAGCPDPWLAIPMKRARERLKRHEPHSEPLTSPSAICASYGRILDEEGLTFFGNTEKEVQDKALQFVESNKKSLDEL